MTDAGDRPAAPAARRPARMQVFLRSVQDIGIGGRAGTRSSSSAALAPDLEGLETGCRGAGEAAHRAGLTDVSSDQQRGRAGDASSSIDREAAARLGVHVQASRALNSSFAQRQVSSSTARNQYRVILEVEPGPAGDPSSWTISMSGQRRRAGAAGGAGQLGRATAPLAVNHQGHSRRRPSPSTSRPACRSARRQAPCSRPRARSACRTACAPSSPATPRPSSARSRPAAADPGGAAAVYIVLGMLYEHLLHPITILSTLPTAGIGALLALLVTGTPLHHHRADRRHPADRHRQEERHHDGGLRAGA